MHMLIIDDHDFVCAGLKATLMDRFDDAQISIANDGCKALDILSKGSINLVISDLFMPGSSGGFSFIDLICKNHPKVPLIVLSASENPSHIRKCVAIGAMGFVTKSAPKRSLFSAIDKALSGEIYMPESLIRPMPGLTRIMSEVDQGSEAISGLLTERQLDILARISKGLSNKLIARELDLSENTIKVHVSAILRALGLNNRTQAGLMGQKLASTLASESADNDD